MRAALHAIIIFPNLCKSVFKDMRAASTLFGLIGRATACHGSPRWA